MKKKLNLTILIALLSVVRAYGDGLEIRVQNLASHRPAVNGLTPGSLIYIQPWFRTGTSFQFHTYSDLTGLSLQIRSSTESTDRQVTILPLKGVSFGLTAVLPAGLPLGDGELTFFENGQASVPASILIVSSSFGLFVSGFHSEGQAIAQNIGADGTPSLNQLTNATRRHQAITLWGTGLGVPDGETVQVDIGNKRVIPVFAGPAPGLVGIDQLNVVIPEDAPLGCYVPIVVKTGRLSTSNVASISIADQGDVCGHPLGLSPDALAVLDAGRWTTLSSITFESTVSQSDGDALYRRQEYGLAQFGTGDSASVAQVVGFTPTDEMLPWCRVTYDQVSPSLRTFEDLDAGGKISITGPSGEVLDLLPASIRGYYLSDQSSPDLNAPYSSPPPRYFQAGRWRVQTPGGSAIPAFETQLTIPQEAKWTNRDSWRVIDPGQDQTVTWDWVGLSGDAIVEVALSSTYPIAPSVNGVTEVSSVTAICRTDASAGRVTLPAAILGQIAAVPGFSDKNSYTETKRIAVTLLPRKPVLVSVPLVQGTLMVGTLTYHLTDSASTRFQ